MALVVFMGHSLAQMGSRNSQPDQMFAGFPPGNQTCCPVCEYSLDGLPATNACPECGLGYDADSYLLVDAAAGAHFNELLPAMLEALIYVIPLIVGLWFVGRSAFVLVMASGLLILAVGWMRYRRMRNRPGFLFVGSKGISFRVIGGVAQHVEWPQVRRVAQQKRFGNVPDVNIVIDLTDGSEKTVRFTPPEDDSQMSHLLGTVRRRLGQDPLGASR